MINLHQIGSWRAMPHFGHKLTRGPWGLTYLAWRHLTLWFRGGFLALESERFIILKIYVYIYICYIIWWAHEYMISKYINILLKNMVWKEWIWYHKTYSWKSFKIPFQFEHIPQENSQSIAKVWVIWMILRLCMVQSTFVFNSKYSTGWSLINRTKHYLRKWASTNLRCAEWNLFLNALESHPFFLPYFCYCSLLCHLSSPCHQKLKIWHIFTGTNRWRYINGYVFLFCRILLMLLL